MATFESNRIRGKDQSPLSQKDDAAARSIDDPRVIEQLERYVAAREAGEQPDRQPLIDQFPAIRNELVACLDAIDLVQSANLQLQDEEEISGGVGQDTLTNQRDLTLGDFRLRREIGRGGMGLVYAAEQISLGRPAAVKILPFTAVLDPRQLQRFKNEARSAAMLDHPNIVGVYAEGCERGIHYFAMRYIEGQSVAELLEELRERRGLDPHSSSQRVDGPVKSGQDGGSQHKYSGEQKYKEANPEKDDDREHEATRSTERDTNRQLKNVISTEVSPHSHTFFQTVVGLMIQAAEALEHAHQMGILHRDIKPSNLMVDCSGHLWITDFGLAMIQSDPSLTLSSDILGTLRYMSPEQIQGRRRVMDHRTDIYSLGVTLYELLALSPPYQGADRQELIRNIIADKDPKRPRQINKAIPKDLETIALKAMAKNPTDRYANAQELADDLRRFSHDRPIKARGPSWLDRTTKWSRRNKPIVAAATILLLSAAIAGPIFSVKQMAARRQAQAQRNRAEANLEIDRKSVV